MWEFKECRETIKKFFWSHGKAQEGERAFKQNTLRNPKKGDTIADLDPVGAEAVQGERDARRFVSVEETTAEKSRKSVNFEDSPPPAYELKDFGYQDVPSDEADESDSLIRRSQRQKNKASSNKSSRARRQSRETEESQFMNSGY